MTLKDIIESGKLKTVIDKRYTIEQIREAHTIIDTQANKN